MHINLFKVVPAPKELIDFIEKLLSYVCCKNQEIQIICLNIACEFEFSGFLGAGRRVLIERGFFGS